MKREKEGRFLRTSKKHTHERERERRIEGIFREHTQIHAQDSLLFSSLSLSLLFMMILLHLKGGVVVVARRERESTHHHRR
jgi:hypothetical protein